MFLLTQMNHFRLAHARRRHHQRGDMMLPMTRQTSTKHVRATEAEASECVEDDAQVMCVGKAGANPG